MANTNIKYRLEFDSLKGTTWRLDILNQKQTFDDSIYPLQLTGAASPITVTVRNNNETVYNAINGKSVEATLQFDGTFSIEEFALADERTWFFMLYKNGQIDFVGWCLPDQIKDTYLDPVSRYDVTLLATDGLGSLKGNLYGVATTDPSAIIIPDYGLKSYPEVIRRCLSQLAYNYGNSTLLSSLAYIHDNSNAYTPSQWLNMSVWNDRFYDESGLPDDTYSVLQSHLSSLLISMFQEHGHFYFIHPNDLLYAQNDDTVARQSTIAFNIDFSRQLQGAPPVTLNVGYDQLIKPITPQQNITFDNAYGQVKAKIDFDLLALLYQNPGFEIGATEGALPVGLRKQNTVDAGLHYLGTNAYDGEWAFRVGSSGTDTFDNGSYIEEAKTDGTPGGFPVRVRVPEIGKGISVSFVWKEENINVLPNGGNAFPAWSLILIGNSGTVYVYNFNNPKLNVNGETRGTWVANPPSEQFKQYIYTYITDHQAWNRVNIDAPILPESGTVQFRFYGNLYTPGTDPANPTEQERDIFYNKTSTGPLPNQPDARIYWDAFNITVTNPVDAYNKNVGETHLVYNKTLYAKSETNEPRLDLYSNSVNSYFAGTLGYGLDLGTNVVNTLMWAQKLSEPNNTIGRRLPEVMVRQIAKMYQKPLHIWEGTIQSDDVLMYAIWNLRFFEGAKFMCLHYTHKLKESEVDVVLREITDDDFNYTYTYKPKFEKSARKVSN